MTTDPTDFDRTPPWHPPETTSAASEPLDPGRKLGRYLVESVLGEGTYGRVHLARHEVLGRRVAIKVLHRRHSSRREEIRAFLNEALILADLDHPGIVPVYDAGWEEVGLYYIVSRYIEGGDLGTTLNRGGRLAPHESARVIEAVARALDYAHTRGMVHRDIKPANILLDVSGRPCLADFGVALRDRDFGRGARLTGTPAYMSPEQARGEGHRVDGRSDIFSLGVVLYELLTGQRPFRGNTREGLSEQIMRVEARPPRLIDGTIPDELDRVCLTALAKRASERYPTAEAMAEDLRRYLAGVAEVGGEIGFDGPGRARPDILILPSTRGSTSTWSISSHPGAGQPAVKIVPRGLRPYGADDADDFLGLLPGPRDRSGMPESVGFWRSRIEAGNDRDTFRVGLLFGPSGCGKTSLVRAGLLPRLSGRVVSVYAGATADGIEACLLGELRERCPDLPDGLGLAATLVAIRKGAGLPAGSKILIVLDQFERWLHGRGKSKETELVAALRQCDGEHVQAIVVVRDDSWSSASRFLRDLEDRIVEGGNSAAVDPFDLRHARRVLEAFGRGCGALPEGLAELPVDQESFLARAVSGLAEGDRIVPIRLTLFAMAVKDKAWLPGTLEIIPPTDAGITLLEEILGARWKTPEHRLHRKAARSVLAAILPEPDADPCDRKKSRHELLVASGFASRPSHFEALMRFLMDEVGLITAMNSGGKGHRIGDPSPEECGPCYGLTHDYLMPLIKEWLTPKRRMTRRRRDDSSTSDDG